MIATIKVTDRGVTGAVIFTARTAQGETRFFWSGRGSAVRLMFGDQIVTIDGLRGWNASSEKEAREQIADFLR